VSSGDPRDRTWGSIGYMLVAGACFVFLRSDCLDLAADGVERAAACRLLGP